MDGRFIIGLTGAIGAGKSLVRKMLMHNGALGLDADTMAHDTYTRGAPAYGALVRLFGREILDANGNISRAELGKRVFSSPDDLKKLEEIVHPLVFQAAQNLVNDSPLPIIVIEAIKLLESDLVDLCDCIWVVDAPREKILSRLMMTRRITQDQIEERLAQQSSHKEKLSKTDVVIGNSYDVSQTWEELNYHWKDLMERSMKFQVLESETQTLLDPYKGFLINPSQAQAEILAGWLEQEPTDPIGLVFQDLAPKTSGKADDKAGKIKIAFHMLCELFFAQCLEKIGLKGLACWEMGHLALNVTWFPVSERSPKADMLPFLEKIEGFARLHLCREITLPAPKNAINEIKSMDYQILVDGQSSGFDKSMSGYNQYYKVLDRR